MKIIKELIPITTLVILLVSCKGKYNSNDNMKYNSTSTKTTEKITSKPGSSNSDSIIIKEAAAIFYHPDSLQDAHIKAITKPDIYNSSEHEMFYQMRNAKIVIKKTYPNLKVIEVTCKRFLLIQKNNGVQQIVDLDKFNDARGLILSNGNKAPQLADMTNIESELYRYFKEGQ